MPTAPRTKAYTLGNNGFVYRPILDLLGGPAHIRQARVIIIATSKVMAAAGYNKLLIGMRVESHEVNLCHGNDLDALTAAGLANHPAVYVLALDGRSKVVEVAEDGTARVAGHLTRDHDTDKLVFTPEGTGKMTPTTAHPGPHRVTQQADLDMPDAFIEGDDGQVYPDMVKTSRNRISDELGRWLEEQEEKDTK